MAILKRKTAAEKTDAPAKEPAAKKAPAKKSAPKAATKKVSGTDTSVIVKPLVTEKSAVLASANQYVFVVKKNANRVAVRSAIKALYGVTPDSVNIMNVRGKKVRFGRMRGKRSDWKKVVVTLPAGKTINVYEGV
jgi:large subunit ribosomal protein L23